MDWNQNRVNVGTGIMQTAGIQVACRRVGQKCYPTETERVRDRRLSFHPDWNFLQYVCDGIPDGSPIVFNHRTAWCNLLGNMRM